MFLRQGENQTGLAGLIYRGAGFLQGMISGKIEYWELLSSVCNRHGLLGVLYQCVIALPIPVRQLMQLHFDLDAFVDGLNHGARFRVP